MRRMWRRAARAALFGTLAVAVALVLGAGTATAGQSATVYSVAEIAATSQLNVEAAIPKTVATQVFSGKKNWGLEVTVTYLSDQNTIVTVDSGLLSISSDTQLVGALDSNTDVVQFNMSYAPSPAPGNQPSYTGTATLIKP